MGADDYGLMAVPAEVKVLGFAVRVNLAGIKDAAIAHLRPVVLRHGEQRLEAAITAGGANSGSGQAARRDAEFLQLLAGADAVMVKEQQAIRDGSSNDTDGLGATGSDLSGGLVLGERVGLPARLVWALGAIDRNKSPGSGEPLELI